MAVAVHPPSITVVDCEDDALPARPLLVCPEEPYERRECVLADDLIPIIQHTLEARIKQAEQSNGGSQLHGLIGVRGQLCEESGIAERRLFGILQGEGQVVTLDVADRLLVACDRSIHELTIYNYQEARLAVIEQTAILRTLAKSCGVYIQLSGAKAELPRVRRAWPKRGA